MPLSNGVEMELSLYELRRRNHIKDLFMDLAPVQLIRNAIRMGAFSRSRSDNFVCLENGSNSNRECVIPTATEIAIESAEQSAFERMFPVMAPVHQFSDYLRAKAITIHDVSVQQMLNLIADTFDEFQKQTYLKDQTNVVDDTQSES